MHFSTKPMQKFGFKGFFWGFIFAYFLDCVLWSKLIPTLITIGWNKFLGRILFFLPLFPVLYKIEHSIFPLECWKTFILWNQTRIEEKKERKIRMLLQKWFQLNGSSIGIYSTEWGLLRKQIFIWARPNLSNYCKWK